MIPVPVTLALTIDGSAVAAWAAVRGVLRRSTVPGLAAVAVRETAGVAAMTAGAVTAAGVTAGLVAAGQARTASSALFAALAAVALAAAGYAAGLADARRRPPVPALPAPPVPETLDVGARLLEQMYGDAPGPQDPGAEPGGPHGSRWSPPPPGGPGPR